VPVVVDVMAVWIRDLRLGEPDYLVTGAEFTVIEAGVSDRKDGV
jgi:hypothetical protein